MAGEIQLNSVTLATESGGVASIDSSVNIKGPLNASGSAPIYACRAWVNFNGTGTVAIRASQNVSSITDNSVGNYTVNFTTAMPDANYSASVTSNGMSNGSTISIMALSPYNASSPSAKTTSGITVIAQFTGSGGANVDFPFVDVLVFR